MPEGDTWRTMTDKENQRRRERLLRTPRGELPNWLLVAVAGVLTAAVLLARALS
jgi:hypothetical protein